jgi:hypothetical protein
MDMSLRAMLLDHRRSDVNERFTTSGCERPASNARPVIQRPLGLHASPSESDPDKYCYSVLECCSALKCNRPIIAPKARLRLIGKRDYKAKSRFPLTHYFKLLATKAGHMATIIPHKICETRSRLQS